MKIVKKLFFICISVILFGCSADDAQYNCNYLLDVGVNLSVNLNLPQYNQLLFPINTVRVSNYGNDGIILVRANTNTLLAWDGADPSHGLTGCSTLEIDGINATCSCGDGNSYNLITGTAVGDNDLPCTLKPYRVEALGNNTYLISN